MSQPIKTYKTISYDQLVDKSWAPNRYTRMPKKPDDVSTKKLREVAYINPDSRFFDKKEIDVEDMKLIQGNSVDKKTGKILFPQDIEELPERARLKALKGDILYPLLEVSNPAPVPIKDEKNYLVSDYFGVLAPRSGVDMYYLVWALRRKKVIQQVKAYYQGAFSLRLRLDDLKNIWIPWHEKKIRKEKAREIKEELSKPTIQEEALNIKETIGIIFSEHFDLKKDNFKTNPAVKKISYNKLQNENEINVERLMTVDPEEIAKEENLSVCKMGKIANDIEIGLRPGQIVEEIKDYIIRTKSLYPMRIETGIKDMESEQSLNLDEKYILNKGELLMVTKGSKTGTAAIITEREAGLTFHNSLAKITADEDKILSKYLAMYLNSFLGEYYIQKYAKSSTTTYISIKQFLELPVLLPSIKEQKEMIEMI